MVIYEREIKRLVIPVGYSDQIGGGIPGSCEDAIKEAYKEGKQEQAQEDLSKLESITIRENGVYEPEYGYNHVEVNVSDRKKVVFKVEYNELIYAHNEDLAMSVNGVPVENVGDAQWYGGSPSFIELSGYTKESVANTIEIEFDAVVESEQFPYPQEWDAVYIDRSQVEDFTQELEKTQIGESSYHYHYTFTFDSVPLIDIETYDEGYEQATDDIRNNATDLNVTKNGTYSADTENNEYFKNVVVNVAKTKTLDIYFYFDVIDYPRMLIPPVRNVCYNNNFRPESVEGLGGATSQGWFAFGFRSETDANSIYGDGFCEIGVNRDAFPSAITKVLIDYKEADIDYVRTSFVEQDGDIYWYRIEWGLLNSTSIRSDYQRGYDDGCSNCYSNGYAEGSLMDVELYFANDGVEEGHLAYGLYNGRDLTIDGDDYDSTFVQIFPPSTYVIPYMFQTKVNIHNVTTVSAVTFTVDCNGADSYVIPTIQTFKINGHQVSNMSCSYVETTPAPLFNKTAIYTITFDEIHI